MDFVVGIGGFAVAGGQDDIIKTFALSTCVGLIFFSMRKRVMGMSHIQLPSSNGQAVDNPSRYADLAPQHLLSEMQKKFLVTKQELLISLYGGIDGAGGNDMFRIGEKNLVNTKQALKALGMVYNEVDTGGNNSRTLVAYVNTGIVEVVRRPMVTRAGSPDFVKPRR